MSRQCRLALALTPLFALVVCQLSAAPLVNTRWQLNEASGTTATDSSGNSRDGTLVGGTQATFVPGLFGNGVDLNPSGGNSGYIATPSLSGGTNGILNSDFTVSMWVQARDSGVIAHETNLGGFRQDTWVVDGSGDVHGRVWNFSAGNQPNMGNIPIDGSTWNHVVLRFNENGGTDILDGFVDGVASATQGMQGRSAPNPQGFEFGRDSSQVLAGVSGNFDGLVDDITIFASTLSDGEARWLYEFGSESELQYDSATVQSLFEHHDLGAGGGELTIDGLDWTFFDGAFPLNSGSTPNPGDVYMSGDDFYALLTSTTGLVGIFPPPPLTPEPTSVIVWLAMITLACATLWWRRRYANQS